MKKLLKKVLAVTLCAGTFFTFGVYSLPSAFAAENEIEQEIQITTIPAGNAYIPKGTVLKVELCKEISSKKSKVGDSIPFKLKKSWRFWTWR